MTLLAASGLLTLLGAGLLVLGGRRAENVPENRLESRGPEPRRRP
jgi:hypothetical protein